jgi:hypothetical protein
LFEFFFKKRLHLKLNLYKLAVKNIFLNKLFNMFKFVAFAFVDYNVDLYYLKLKRKDMAVILREEKIFVKSFEHLKINFRESILYNKFSRYEYFFKLNKLYGFKIRFSGRHKRRSRRSLI